MKFIALSNMGLKRKMLLILLIPMIIVNVGLGLYSYHTAKSGLDEQIVRTATYLVEDYANKINTELVTKETAVSNLAAIIGMRPMSVDEVGNLIRAVKGTDQDIANVFIGFDNKQYIEANGWIPPADYDPRGRDWYKKAINTDNVVYSDVYEDQGTKQLVVSILKRVTINGQAVGVVGIDLNLKSLAGIVTELKSGKTGYAYVIDGNGDHIIHPTLKPTDNIFKINGGAFAEAGKIYLSGKPAIQRFSFNGVEKIYSSAPIGKSGWVLAFGVPSAELYEKITAMGWASLITSILAILLLGAIILYSTVRITKPIQQMVELAEGIAEGDFRTKTVSISSNNEIGRLANAMVKMRNSLRELMIQVANAAEQLAASSEQLTASAEQSAQAANQVAGSITNVAKGAEDQLAAVNDTSTVVQQISEGIHQIAVNANEMAQQSSQAAEKANEGNQSVEQAVNQMLHIEQTVTSSAELVAKLGDRSKEIGQIVDTISGIAAQTNLLALNAAIEAARAGEQGRGFAVVAEEVRKLAEQSQEAAKQIATLISEIQGDTDHAVVAMNNGTQDVKAGADVVNVSGQVFKGIVTLVTQLSVQVKEISTAIEQIATGSQQIVGSVKQIDTLSKTASGEAQTVSAATEEQAASMEEISASSQSLAKMAQKLQEAIARFQV